MRNRLIVASALALALVASGCGGDDDAAETSDAPTTDAPTTDAPTTDAPDSTTSSSEAPATTAGDESALGSGSMSAEMAALVDEAAISILADLAANGATAFYVAISDPENGDYLAAYGDAGVDGPAASVDDTFRIGSVTKSFTATVILQLIDDGELSLDDTVDDVHPGIAVDFPELASLTIDQLLGMTSGIEDFANVADSVVADVVDDPSRVWEPYELIETGIDAGVSEPGTAGYSTTNYIVLQLIAEELTGESLQDLITERVIDELELGKVVYPPNDDTSLPEPLTRGYVSGTCLDELASDGAEVDDGTDVTDWNVSMTQGGGQMHSDIASLLNWAESMSGNATLSDDLAATRMADTKLVAGLDYGLGIFRLGTNWWGHEGENIGWESLELHDPDTGVSVAVAANGCGGQFALFGYFIDALYPDGMIIPTLQENQAAMAAAEAESTTATTEPSTTSAPDEGESVDENAASGTVTMTVGDTTVEASIVQCTVAEPDVQFLAVGETAEISVAAIGGGDTSVTVSGAFEFEGVGTAAFNPDTSALDQGDVMVVGQGAPPDDSAPIADFTLDARGLSC